jgi:hypothetical protein
MSIVWTDEQASAYLRAMKSVASRGGSKALASIERETIVATAEHVLKCDVDVEALDAIGPSDLAAAITDPHEREQLVQFLTVVPYLDTVLDPGQIAQVNGFARALQLKPHALDDLNAIAKGRRRRLLIDYTRRAIGVITDDPSRWGAFKHLAKDLFQYFGEPEVAAKYQALEQLPSGTLGREYFDFYRARGFPLPGEQQSLSEDVVGHDCSHILGGFNTDLRGELNVAGMEAGMVKKEGLGFELLMEVLLDFHLGISFTTINGIEPAKGAFDPEGFAMGFAIGEAMTVDLMTNWAPFDNFERSVEELRDEYGIVPFQEGRLSAPPDQAAAAAAARPGR